MTAFCVSYPKSGRTWLRVMLNELDAPLEYTHLSGKEKTFGLPFQGLVGAEKVRSERVVFLYRDPRDTVVSAFHQMTSRKKYSLTKKLRLKIRGRMPPFDLEGFVKSPGFGIERIIFFNLTCAANLDAFAVSYENMRRDPVNTLQSILAYLEQDVAEERIRAVVEDHTIEKMRQREKDGTYRSNMLGPTDPTNPNSFKARKGKVGGWRSEMNEATKEFAEAMLLKHDYFSRMNLLLEN